VVMMGRGIAGFKISGDQYCCETVYRNAKNFLQKRHPPVRSMILRRSHWRMPGYPKIFAY
jgi:hypothetical protein